MNQFSISQLQQFSGVKAHTIRIWEQRYNALSPSRSEGNTRFYDGNQLRRLLNIVSLLETDYKISELCAKSDDELYALINKQIEVKLGDENSEYYISQLIAAALNFDETHFEKIFSTLLLRKGLLETYETIIYPLLERVGQLWASNSIRTSNEHFLSNLIKKYLKKS